MTFKEYVLEMADILVAPERLLVSVSGEQDVERSKRRGGKYRKSDSPFINKYLERPDVDSSYSMGGKYFDVKTGEVLNGKIYEKGYVDTSNGPKMNVENEMEGGIESTGKKVLVNLLNPKNFPWLWVDNKNQSKNIKRMTKKGEGKPISSIPIVSIESGKHHVYAVRVEFKNPVVLKNYPDGGEPRLRPTSFGSIQLSNEIYGECYIYSGKKKHPVYSLVEIS
jgi:hypothetical protein